MILRAHVSLLLGAAALAAAVAPPPAEARPASVEITAIIGASGESDASSSASFADASSAYDYLREKANWGQTVDLPTVEAAATLIEAAAKSDPNNPRWHKALAIALFHRKDFAGSRAAAEKAVALAPKDADAHYVFGNSCFNGIMDAGTLDQMSLASKGRKAYEKAIELDPAHADARFALFQFYLGAPGIAGGSVKRARVQANEMLKIEREKFRGNLMLAQAAGKDEEWTEMNAAFDAADAAASTDVERRWAASSRARFLLREKKDFKASIPAAQRVIEISRSTDPNDATGYIYLGEAHRELKEHPAAISAYLSAIDLERGEASRASPTARIGLARSYDAVGEHDKALAMYDEFLEKFPKDSRAKDAQSEAKKIRRKLKK